MADGSETEAPFFKADLFPAAMQYRCTQCDTTFEASAELKEDDYGNYRIADEDRFIECPGCQAFLDIG